MPQILSRKAKLLILSIALLLMAAVIQACTANASTVEIAPAETTSTITYIELTSNFANPERGLYHYLETRASNRNNYNLAQLTQYRTDEKITLTYCINYLDEFRDGPISAEFLDHIQSNLNTLRQAGLKCIIRFAYTDDWNNETPPYADASKAIVLQHIEQLKPILQQNSDVIALMQAGFIGVWGEWYYTSHFVDDPNKPSDVSAAQWQNRLDVIEAEMDALPHRFVAVRYAHAKTNLFGTNTPITATNAYDGSTFSRITFHNDCFLASSTDFGTYFGDANRQFMVDDTAYGAMGGETCNVNPPRSECETALAELAEFHFSYLNIDYKPEVLDRWRAEGCFDEIQKQLGYRLELQKGTYSDTAHPGGSILFELELKNSGYASPFNPRPVQILLRDAVQPDQIYRVTLPDDLRRWFAKETQTLDYELCLPSSITAGRYDLLLNLPDEAVALNQNPAYAILFANGGGVQETATGFNNLQHQISINEGDKLSVCNSNLSFTSLSDPLTGTTFLPLITAKN